MAKNDFKRLSREMNKAAKRSEKLDGEHSVPLSDLMTRTFMSKHTSHSDFESWMEAGGFSAQNAEEFDAIDATKLDEYVASSTRFSNWEEMLGEATGDWGLDQIFGR